MFSDRILLMHNFVIIFVACFGQDIVQTCSRFTWQVSDRKQFQHVEDLRGHLVGAIIFTVVKNVAKPNWILLAVFVIA